jgi:hypothetical protein
VRVRWRATPAVDPGRNRRSEISYESRTPLPHHLFEESVAITGVDLEDLFTA